MNTQIPRDESIELERYELFQGPSYRFELPRRDFFKATGCGLIVLLLAGETDAQESGGGRRGTGGNQRTAPDVDAWIHIGEDGTISVFTGKVEVGQNIRTSLSQAVAEELRTPISSIKMVMGDTDLTPYDAGTFGSQTTPQMAPTLRRAAASAREALLDLAAETWKVDRSLLSIADGKVLGPSGKTETFGGLTKGQKILKTVGNNVETTAAGNWKIEGHSIPKVNGRDFVTGRHRYTSDQKIEGMLYGKIIRPAGFGATLNSVDSQAAEAMPGVTVVRDGNFLGVTAPSEVVASKAAEAIRADWSVPAQPSEQELFALLKRTANGGGAGGRGGGGGSSGSIETGLEQADFKSAANYTVAYIAHVPLEPRAALAHWVDGKLTVWTGTQRPFGVRAELMEAFRVPENRVRVIMPDTGSGYGGKHTGAVAVEAARLAKAAGKPVKLVWTREEEFTWAYFRPAGWIEVHAGVSKEGVLTAWEFHNYNSGGSGVQTPYNVPNRRVEVHTSRSPLSQGSYRALASTANHFAREVHMDDLARLVKMDPLDFRLKNLSDERLRAVLNAAAKAFRWGEKPAKGHGFGIAGGTEKGGYVATCVEVAIQEAEVRVVRTVTAFECGAIVNPDHLKNQVEGAVMMGLGGALFEAIHFNAGKILNPHLARYRVPRFADMPQIETVLVNRPDLPSAGAGECPIIAIAPAIGNAIYDASGIRLRDMPMVPKGLPA